MTPQPSLRTGLLRHRLDDQLLVYDRQEEQVHLLDGTTASVVEMLDQGIPSDSIAGRLGGTEGVEGGAELLALALDQLAQARLIDPSEKSVAPMRETTRRQMIQRLAGLSAALIVPAIVTLAPRPAYAVTGGGIGTACSASTQCSTNCCKSNGNATQGQNTCQTSGGGNNCYTP